MEETDGWMATAASLLQRGREIPCTVCTTALTKIEEG